MDEHDSGILYRNLADSLRRKIMSGRFALGAAFPTVQALRQETGYSRNTILAALKRLAQDGFIQRGATKRHGYTVASLSGNQHSHKTSCKPVEIVLPFESWNYVGANILDAIQRQAHRAGLQISARNQKNSVEEEIALLEKIAARPSSTVRALVLMTSRSYDHPRLEFLRELQKKTPVVLLDRKVEGLNTHFIGIDNHQVGWQAVRRLAAANRTPIAFVGGGFENLSTSVERLSGYTIALGRYGLSHRSSLIYTDDSHTSNLSKMVRKGWDIAGRISDLENPPGGLVCMNDKVAAGVISHLRKRGLDIPGDIALIGVDNDKRIAESLGITISGFSYPYKEIASETVGILNRLMAGDKLPVRSIEFPAVKITGQTA